MALRILRYPGVGDGVTMGFASIASLVGGGKSAVAVDQHACPCLFGHGIRRLVADLEEFGHKGWSRPPGRANHASSLLWRTCGLALLAYMSTLVLVKCRIFRGDYGHVVVGTACADAGSSSSIPRIHPRLWFSFPPERISSIMWMHWLALL